jgi:hypothetical protein
MKKKKSEAELSELRKSVSELAKNYSQLIFTMNEFLQMSKPLIKIGIEKLLIKEKEGDFNNPM